MNTPEKEKIGILGGTFNPVHLGHLILAQGAMEARDLSRVLFVPCAKPPHKELSSLIPVEHRVAMLEAAIEDNPGFELSDVEISREGTSYAVDTVRELRKMYPSSELYFIIGSDTLPELHLWKDIHKLLKLCKFITFSRSGDLIESMNPADLHLNPPWPERLLKASFSPRLVDISSSDIRHRVAEGMSIRYLVPQAVEVYITENHLYVK